MSDNPGVEVRASDRERDALVSELRQHMVDGRLTVDEFAERMEAAFASKTRAELDVLRHDLPVADAPATSLAVRTPRKASRWVVGVMGPSVRRGRWRIEGELTTVAVMSPMKLDLTEVELDGDEVTIKAYACMSPLQIVVPDDMDVDVSGFSIMGPRMHRGGRTLPPAGARRVHIRAYTLMGPVFVTTKAVARAGAPSQAALPGESARELGR
jgi:hypothetical protein